MLDHLTTSVKYLRGVGPRTAAAFAKLGIYTERDLILHFPRAYQDRTRFFQISESRGSQQISVKAKVTQQRWLPVKGRGKLLKIYIEDEQGSGVLVCFNRPFLADQLKPGVEVIVTALFSLRFGEWQTSSFDYEIVDSDDKGSLSAGRVVPLYSLTAGITQKLVRRSVFGLLNKYQQFPEVVPQYLAQKRGLLSFDSAIRTLHFPEDTASVTRARQTIAYIEFFIFQLALLYRRNIYATISKLHSYIEEDFTERLESQFGFSLSQGQCQALDEIYSDMRSKKPMHRLLLGDVGSGKTAVAAAALLLAVSSGHQAAVAAPTGILAKQLFQKLSAYLEPFGVSVAFLSGQTAKKERVGMLAKLQSGAIQLIVGTHALFSPEVVFADLSLVVIDEQHRFGVRHRKTLRSKGEKADYLAMSATPIPRSLALSLYGDCAISRIKGQPFKREPVATFWLRGEDRVAMDQLAKQLQTGRQGYIVYPLVEETEKSDLKAAVSAYEKIKEAFAEYGVGLLHGRVSDAEKDDVMVRFNEGKIGVLVSTTVVEVGIDNKNAVVMVVQDAQRFGLSQLHQLRGRVGRGAFESFCYLVTSSYCGEETAARMKVMVSSRDGFFIAEEDLRLRGPGDFFGVNQSGIPLFFAADIVEDSALLDRARKDLLFILQKDHLLESPYNTVLKDRAQKMESMGSLE